MIIIMISVVVISSDVIVHQKVSYTLLLFRLLFLI